MSHDGQNKVAGTFQLAQCFHAATGLRKPARIEKTEMRAHRTGKRGPRTMCIGSKQLTHRFNRILSLQRLFDLVLFSISPR